MASLHLLLLRKDLLLLLPLMWTHLVVWMDLLYIEFLVIFISFCGVHGHLSFGSDVILIILIVIFTGVWIYVLAIRYKRRFHNIIITTKRIIDLLNMRSFVTLHIIIIIFIFFIPSLFSQYLLKPFSFLLFLIVPLLSFFFFLFFVFKIFFLLVF